MGSGNQESIAPSNSSTGSRLITSLVAPAVKLWLRSQVEAATEITVRLDGRDREILAGRLPQAQINAESVVYQGLHLSHLNLQATNIAVNLGQVLRGKPLRLLQPIPVSAELKLFAPDLAASLAAPLLAPALADFLAPLLALWGRPVTFEQPQATLAGGQLILSGAIEQQPVQLCLGLELVDPQTLQLCNPQWLNQAGEPIAQGSSVLLPLGEDVAINSLSIKPEGLQCTGTLLVRP
ncbi:MAG: DUF2993 domain-containing protein [Limnothrix sp. CACIAM 69d]|nr:MAG: DUF2993 domain-containing protein [Limnothrix sp. CACIAM 69d]